MRPRLRRAQDPRVAAVMAEAPRERLLAWGALVDDRVVVCTDLAIHIPDVGRVAWDRIVRAAWSEVFLDLVLERDGGGRPGQVRLRFEKPGEVPSVVRERIEWTIVASQHIDLVGAEGRRGGAMFNARRSPATGEVRWAVVFDAGIDPRDPAWQGAADAALARLRDSLGT